MKLKEVSATCKLCKGYFVVYVDEETPKEECDKVRNAFVCAKCSEYGDLTGYGLFA